MLPYDEGQVTAFQTDVQLAYQKAGRSVDLNNVVWAARMVYDATTLGYPASRAKHLSELYLALGLQPPFEPAPREYAGQMCGVRVAGLPAVLGGAADPSLALSWFYDRYTGGDRILIRQAWRAKNYTDVLLSWPDSQAIGQTADQFRGTCLELMAYGFRPAVMLSAKPTSSATIRTVTETLDNILSVLPLLVGIVPRFCVGWELSLWLSPTDVQWLIDRIAPLVTPSGATLSVHFQEGYFAYQLPGLTTADFWKANVGKLTSVWHQRKLDWDKPMYQARITDCLVRFAGGFNFPTDSGFGHPFDFVALEITASPQFNGQMSEADGDSWGQTALSTPPSGAIGVNGSGNGS